MVCREPDIEPPTGATTRPATPRTLLSVPRIAGARWFRPRREKDLCKTLGVRKGRREGARRSYCSHPFAASTAPVRLGSLAQSRDRQGHGACRHVARGHPPAGDLVPHPSFAVPGECARRATGGLL